MELTASQLFLILLQKGVAASQILIRKLPNVRNKFELRFELLYCLCGLYLCTNDF